jgi:uncharacterized membrane protein
MKKYLYPLLTLSIIGAALTAVLLVQHYNPEADMGIFSCGSGLANPCVTLEASPYSTVLGIIPIPLLGLFFYLFLIFVILIADYAMGWYIPAAIVITIPLIITALAVDLVLGLIMLLKIGTFCKLCFATYMINMVLLIVSALFYSDFTGKNGGNYMTMLKDMFSKNGDSPDRRAATASFTLFVFLLAFSLFSTNHIMGSDKPKHVVSDSQMKSFLDRFYATDVEKIDLPESRLIIGPPHAELSIVVFTDFLCSACYSFFRTEK